MNRHISLLLATALLTTLAACAPAPSASPAMSNDKAMTATEVMTDTVMTDTAMTDTMMTDTMMTDTMMTDTMMTDTMMTDSHALSETEMMTDTMMPSKAMEGKAMEGEAALMELPAWMTMPLTDARTGATMTLADLKGKTVFVEAMATWCPNCRTQLGNVKAAYTKNTNPDIVFVAISVETDLSADQLAQYANDNGFNWFFAVSSPELLLELVNAFGQTIANPPATPHFVIKADGTVGTLVTGFEGSEQILAGLQN